MQVPIPVSRPEDIAIPHQEVAAQPIERRPVPQFLKDDLRNRFNYHPPLGDQVDRYSQVREEVLQLGNSICELCPESRERERALEKLDEVMMLANAAIARRE